ncbi:MAG: DUF6516 family protein [Candidatus Scalindua sp.]|nr:DUF6516 family protein [Candidatus Scalindua sp.]
MILRLYKQLENVANNEYGDIIENVEIIRSHAGRARKLRIELIDSTYIDIFYSAEKNYSFHWEQKNVRNSIYRHDNAPHKKWSNIKTFPKHCHDGDQGNVIESDLPDNPDIALRVFLSFVRKKIIEQKHK